MSMAEPGRTTQYLSFYLADEVYAIDISRVREVLDFTSLTVVPKMPEYMRGVINLRGSVVPVIDLRLKFGMGRTEYTISTCIVIVEVSMGSERLVLGALADSVQEVFDLRLDEMAPAPKIGTQLHTEFLSGMGMKDDRFILLLDMDNVFHQDELDTARRMADAPHGALAGAAGQHGV